MAAPKVLQVLKSMSSDEIADIDALVSGQKKNSLKKLFKLLCKTDPTNIDKLDKELAYMQVFGKKYTPENDYLWRNELRLLMDMIEQYAAEKMMRAELDASDTTRSKYFLKYLLEKNLFTLISSESERIKEAAEKEFDYRTIIDVCEIINPYLANFAWNDISMQEKMAANGALYKEAANRNFLHVFRKAQVAITASQLFRHKEKFRVEMPEADVDQYFGGYEDAYSQYLSLRILTISTPQGIDPDKYQTCLDHLAANPTIPGHVKERFLLLTNLSGYYFFKHDYEEAFTYNKELIKLADTMEPVYAIAAVYNYMSNLAHLERYDEALDCMQKYNMLISQFPNQAERFDYIVASCYALKGDRVAFNASLPRQFDEMSKLMQYHYRFLISLSHFLDKEYQLAIMEVTNIERSIKALKSEKLNYYDGVIAASEHLCVFFDLYQEYKLDGNNTRVKKKIIALKAEIDQFIPEHQMTSGLLFYRWMIVQVELMVERLL